MFQPFVEQLPSNVKINYSSGKLDDAASRKRKGKCKEGENDFGSQEQAPEANRLVTLDIFAGCGGLSEGLHQSGKLYFFHFAYGCLQS